MATLHQIRKHPQYVEGCWGCHASSLQLATGQGNESFSAKMDRNLDKDRPAYKALKEQGIQPARVVGCHELVTRAKTRFEIESGHILNGSAKQIESVVDAFTEGTGASPLKAATTPKPVADG